MLEERKRLAKHSLILLILFIGATSFIPINIFSGQNHKYLSADSGVVIVVYDGDTIKVRFEDGAERKVRLIGVDSPEIEDERENIRLFAFVAKRFSFSHLYRKKVRLSFDWEREDKYGRLLAYVWYDGDILFNEFILSEGFAYAFLKYPFKEEFRQRFVQAEKMARKREKGFWQREPLPSVPSSEAKQNIGKYISVTFKCTDVRSRGRFVFLYSPDDFSALIPRNSLPFFSDVQSFEGRSLSVKGFLEDYKGKAQIIVFLPLQIK